MFNVNFSLYQNASTAVREFPSSLVTGKPSLFYSVFEMAHSCCLTVREGILLSSFSFLREKKMLTELKKCSPSSLKNGGSLDFLKCTPSKN